MNWLVQLIVLQFVVAMILTAAVYFVWRVTHPGQKW
jgi:hypothetical protein